MISYLQAENISKRYGENLLFENISINISKDQKIALIARNGKGKTSLLNIISGIDNPDSGKISKKNDLIIGYLSQEPKVDDELTVIEQTLQSSNKIVNTIKEYEQAIESKDQKCLQKALEKMDAASAWDYEVKIKQILSQLNITNYEQPIKQLSGGQKKRVALANVLINEPDFLILDEPTNHLDLEMIEWLEDYLKRSKVTLFMVTHDRYFLDRVCNEIIELEDDVLYQYKGNYSYYLEKREERIAITNAEREKAENLYRRELDWMRRTPQARTGKAKYRIDNFYKLKDAASKKHVDESVEIGVKGSRLGNKIIEIYDINKKFDNVNILEDFSYKFTRFEKVGIVGKNGTGKTTFLNLITKQIPVDSGNIEIGTTIQFGYYQQKGITFNLNDRVIDVVKEIAEVVDLGDGRKLTAAQFLEHFLFSPKMHYNKVEKLSGGEKRRLYLLTILMKNPNFLILDEPTNDLDIMTLNVLEEYLINFKGCVLLVSHDRYFMDKVVDHLFVFEGEGKVKDFPGDYTLYREYEAKKQKEIEKEKTSSAKSVKATSIPKRKKKFGFKENREFEQIEKELKELETEKQEIESLLFSGNLPQNELMEKTNRISQIIETIDEKEMRWLELIELKEEDEQAK